MTNSNQPQLFDIWLVYLRFIDHPNTGKVRPVLVVGISDDVIAVVKITSRPPEPDTGDVPIVQWQQAGLNTPSTVRCSQVFEISFDELLRDMPVGFLQPLDMDGVTQSLTKLGYLHKSENQ